METNKQVDFSKTTSLDCDCGNDVFMQVYFFRKVSPLMTTTGKPGIVPIQTFACTACGKIPKEFDLSNNISTTDGKIKR